MWYKHFAICLAVLSILSCGGRVFALEVTVQNDTDVLLNWLLGSGSASNPYFYGPSNAIGVYTNTSGLWGLDSGIAISSGNVSNYSDGPNTSGSFSTDFGAPGHAGLSALTGYPTYDAMSFGFDFTAMSNQISFDFLYGTDEYAEYVGSQFNDAFGAWLTDSKGTKTQLSFDNTGHPITVNAAWMSDTPGTELDGTTGLLQTTATVAKGQNYSIEFAVADASDHIFDSTVYLSDFLGAGPLEERPGIYGLFLGIEQDPLRGDLQAQNLYNVVSANLADFKEGTVLTGNMADGGLTQTQVQQAIVDLGAKMGPDDKLMVYSISHGGSYASGTETTLSPGDEVLSLGYYLSDDDFKDYFAGLEQVEKWVMLDACHSGGFWGNNNPLDGGDLEKLTNTSLFAASAEDQYGWFNGASGLPYFGSALVDAFSFDSDGYLFADLDEDGYITFDELTYWVQHYATQSFMDGTVVYEMDFGDSYVFTSDMWTPTSLASDGFGGSFGYVPPADPHTNPVSSVPVPGALVLVSMGTGLIGCLCRRRVI